MLDARIQSYVREVAARGRDVVPAGDGWTALLHPRDPLRYLNYAVPAAGADGPPNTAVFAARGRLPRVEYVESQAPALAAALEAAGWSLEARLDLMTCTPQTLRRPDPPAGVTFEEVPGDAPRETVRDLLAATRGAFGADPPADEVVASWGAGGGLSLLVRAEDGAPAGGGSFTAPLDGLTELAGIGVLAPFRRRGIAAALTSALAAAAFERSVDIAFLTPGDDDTRRVYERAGFTATSTMLAYAREP